MSEIVDSKAFFERGQQLEIFKKRENKVHLTWVHTISYTYELIIYLGIQIGKQSMTLTNFPIGVGLVRYKNKKVDTSDKKY